MNLVGFRTEKALCSFGKASAKIDKLLILLKIPPNTLPSSIFGNLKSPSFALRPSNGLKFLRPSLIFGNGFNDLSLFLNYHLQILIQKLYSYF